MPNGVSEEAEETDGEIATIAHGGSLRPTSPRIKHDPLRHFRPARRIRGGGNDYAARAESTHPNLAPTF